MEMFRVFNMGIGMVVIAPKAQAEEILLRLSGLQETAFLIGEIGALPEEGAPQVRFL